MKNIKKRILIIALFVLMIIIFPKDIFAATTGIVDTETVRMRKEATTESDIVTLLSQDFKVEIIEKEGNWYKVKYKEYTGYVSAEYIKVDNEVSENVEEKKEEKIETQTETETEKTTEETSVVNTPEKKSLNVNTKYNLSKKAKLYYLPLIYSRELNTIEENEEAFIIQIVNNWAYVKIDKEFGWIRLDSFENKTEVVEEKNEEQIEETENNENQEAAEVQEEKKEETASQETKTMYINASNVNFRKSADKSSDIIDTLSLNTEVEVLSEEDGWYKITVDGKTGYVSASLISDEKTVSSRSADEPRTSQQEEAVEVSSGDSDLQSQIVEYAKSFLGCPYVYGGTSPSGFDCSGFVQYVYRHFGYSISRSSKTQVNDGVGIYDENDLEPGDILIFKAYDDGSTIGHVGLYIGNNQFIHASDEKTGVIITSLSAGRYPQRFVCGRRIV